ncbi:hypothetical protein Cst_c27400 [Thermoclostridium stercorarium subsp. stercorarium DSM 8532]|jgi:hypothetical protein|uniref:Uncharacterized protein n=3 Tax=Thermoclostridium stercorarium TaxID=1510 RepID=L7VVX5_THES1|nr:hypothetical protein [Thermoclostridium stercorarium]AGC69683.1 hypothetical protein Cst_c27400 [Thermoclostridium stercorarium subsp. stercorarium DSM 8532]AGI40636.1 hypothetical protein Clst_2627 [Thermoclostridium stercorarium subsp. stercorarium DSM 8532]ANW99903.1 hypothetical protein CSTERTH_13135 [Thermoclostridium stercorarium subsp. thermolacticum DSM 2910]ANX02528.1 hypothetical protein CSTERLE_13640 [Thermoclostridium stercorarium subsp. leptospartum DSM 9219]UZQ85621.1 hypothet
MIKLRLVTGISVFICLLLICPTLAKFENSYNNPLKKKDMLTAVNDGNSYLCDPKMIIEGPDIDPKIAVEGPDIDRGILLHPPAPLIKAESN